jgi:hypothetical protein
MDFGYYLMHESVVLAYSVNIIFKDISKLLLEKSGVSESPSYFQQRISIAIQRGNAASVLGTVAKSSGLEEVFYLFKI